MVEGFALFEGKGGVDGFNAFASNREWIFDWAFIRN